MGKPDIRGIDAVKPNVLEHFYGVLPFHITDD